MILPTKLLCVPTSKRVCVCVNVLWVNLCWLIYLCIFCINGDAESRTTTPPLIRFVLRFTNKKRKTCAHQFKGQQPIKAVIIIIYRQPRSQRQTTTTEERIPETTSNARTHETGMKRPGIWCVASCDAVACLLPLSINPPFEHIICLMRFTYTKNNKNEKRKKWEKMLSRRWSTNGSARSGISNCKLRSTHLTRLPPNRRNEK